MSAIDGSHRAIGGYLYDLLNDVDEWNTFMVPELKQKENTYIDETWLK